MSKKKVALTFALLACVLIHNNIRASTPEKNDNPGAPETDWLDDKYYEEGGDLASQVVFWLKMVSKQIGGLDEKAKTGLEHTQSLHNLEINQTRLEIKTSQAHQLALNNAAKIDIQTKTLEKVAITLDRFANFIDTNKKSQDSRNGFWNGLLIAVVSGVVAAYAAWKFDLITIRRGQPR